MMFEEPEALSNAPNSPTIDIKLMGQISEDFAKVSDLLKEAAYQIRQKGFSSFPVFGVSPSALPLGIRLVGTGELNDNRHHYHASMLEEFIQRGIVAEDGIEAFKANYKNVEEFCCLFFVQADFAGFVFIPYPEEESETLV
jgi:hypothetical protein